MAGFETVEVPFHQCGNRQILTSLQMAQEPWLRDFVARFPHCFEYMANMDALLFYPDGDAPKGIST